MTKKCFTLNRLGYTLYSMNPKKVVRKVLPRTLIRSSEELYRKGRAVVVNVRYGRPAQGLRIIAITGTNGKTSTCNFLNDVLKYAGFTTAMFTTAVIEMAGDRKINTSHRTVPLAGELFGLLRTAKAKKVDWVILETTSHSLEQHKVWGIPIEIAVMTNLTQDHLDYHGTMEKYAAAKARLFSKYTNPKWCVLNRDDEWFDYYSKGSIGRIFTYGKKKGSDLRISSLTSSVSGVKMRFDTHDSSIIASSPVVGEFNGYNLAATASIATILEIAPDVIRKALESILPVPGRMELISSSRGFTAIVDYAHAPDALEKALQALREAKAKRVVVVFGATGDRDKSKRPIMGEIAAHNADVIYLTDDETYTEDGSAIRREVFEGIVRGGGREKTAEISDRLEAIRSALKNAQKGDMILIAGLGHQNYRAMNEGHVAWQETDIVKGLLKELDLA